MRRFLAPLLLLALGIGASYLFWDQTQNNANHSLTLYGNVDIRDVSLSFRVSGRIKAMHFEEGDRVSPGTVLATLEQDTFEEDLALAHAEIDEAKAGLINAELTYKRRAKIVHTGAVTQALLDDALAMRDQAQARVAAAKARAQKAQTALGDTQIIAPAAGIILTRVREPGAIVQIGQAVYTLALHTPVWIRTYVDEPDLGRIYPGQKATIMTDSGDQYTGQIGFISPQAEFTPKTVETSQLRTDLVYRLRVIVEHPDQRLRQGMPVTVYIDESQPVAGKPNAK